MYVFFSYILTYKFLWSYSQPDPDCLEQGNNGDVSNQCRNQCTNLGYECAIWCFGDKECESKCRADQIECINKCPCYPECPDGCPCPNWCGNPDKPTTPEKCSLVWGEEAKKCTDDCKARFERHNSDGDLFFYFSDRKFLLISNLSRMSEINVLADAKVTESAKTVVMMIISTNVLITVLAILTVRMAVLVTIIMGNSIARIILQGQHKYFK